MGIRTVRLDEEAERALQEIQAATSMPISAAFKRGLRVVRDEVVRMSRQTRPTAATSLRIAFGAVTGTVR